MVTDDRPAPSGWITKFAHLAHGAVLDVACGLGRHTVFFADQNLPVTAIDRDISRLGGLCDHPKVTVLEADLESETPWRPDPAAWDTIVVTNYLWRPLLPHLVRALRPGGVLIYETFAAGNEAFGKPKNPDFLLQPGELLDVVGTSLTVIAYEHGEVADPNPAVVPRICAMRGEITARL
jgi:SAM-dependent methyltransferase